MNTLGPPHTNLQTPPGVRSKVVRNGVRIGKTSIIKGIFRSKLCQTHPWVESRGRSDTYALPSEYHPSRTARDPAGTAMARENPENFPATVVSGGGERLGGDFGPLSAWFFGFLTLSGGYGFRPSGGNLSHGVSLHGSACT